MVINILEKAPKLANAAVVFLQAVWDDTRARRPRTHVGENGHQHARKSPQAGKRSSSNFAPQ